MIKIGHRGASGYAMENTIGSIKKALSLGVDMIELDVRKCASGELVLMHDKTIERITDGEGAIKSLTWDQLQDQNTLDGQKIITLDQALDLIDGHCQVNLHVKVKGITRPLYAIIRAKVESGRWNIRQFLISSFHYRELERLKKIDPKLKVGLLYYRGVFSVVKRASKIGAYSVHLNKRLLKPKIINSLRRLGIKSIIWTVNQVSDIEQSRRLRVDGMISDFPDLI